MNDFTDLCSPSPCELPLVTRTAWTGTAGSCCTGLGGGMDYATTCGPPFQLMLRPPSMPTDPIGRAMLLQFKRQAQVMADILGDGMVEELDSVLWIVADPRHKGFGTEVDAGLLTNEATGVAFTTKGIVVLEGVGGLR